MEGSFPPIEVLALILPQLNLGDIVCLMQTCKYVYTKISTNAALWRHYVYMRYSLGVYTNKLTNDAVDWKQVAFQYGRDKQKVRDALLRAQVMRRLNEPMQSKEYFQFFMQLETHKTEPTRDLLGNLVRGAPPVVQELSRVPLVRTQIQMLHGDVQMIFARSDATSFLIWQGEANVKTRVHFYLVNRQLPGNRLDIPIVNLHVEYQSVLMGRRQYEEMGRLAHKDATYYEGKTRTNYKFSTAHAQMRRLGGDLNDFGSNSIMKEYPRVAAMVCSQISVFLPLATMEEYLFQNDNPQFYL